MRYGVPCQGSKNRLAREIIESLPPAETFVDLFAGGCAVAHAAILSGKFRRVIINDIDGRGVRLFRAAMAGAYHNETNWVTREQFRVNIRKPAREQDPFAALAWSFNANLRDYLYAREIEQLQYAKHAAIAWNDLEPLRQIGLRPPALQESTVRGRYYELGAWIEANAETVRNTYKDLQTMKADKRIKKIHQLDNIQRLLGLQELEGIAGAVEIVESAVDYSAVDIPPGAVVYCDIPYKGTDAVYVEGFDHQRFYDWAAAQTCLLYISEYSMPPGQFDIVKSWNIQKLSTSNGCGGLVHENLYTVAARAAPIMGQICLF